MNEIANHSYLNSERKLSSEGEHSIGTPKGTPASPTKFLKLPSTPKKTLLAKFLLSFFDFPNQLFNGESQMIPHKRAA